MPVFFSSGGDNAQGKTNLWRLLLFGFGKILSRSAFPGGFAVGGSARTGQGRGAWPGARGFCRLPQNFAL